ncbi:MAG: hypothetical protein ACFCD0_24490 [Gemmataceae bacterium]
MNLFKNLFSTGTKNPKANPTKGKNRAQLSLESLEERAVPATFGFESGSTLYVFGDDSVNKVEIKDNGTNAPGNIRYRLDSRFSYEDDRSPWTQTRGNISYIRVMTYGGDDIVRYRLTNSLRSSGRQTLNVSAGDGNDIVWGEVRGNLSSYSWFNMYAYGGNGNDQLAAFGFGDLSYGSYLNTSLYGQQGNDAIYGLMDNDVDVSYNATVSMNLYGDQGYDYFEARYDGELDGRVLLNLRGGDQNDTARVRFFMDTGSSGTVGDRYRSALVAGDSGNDYLDFQIWKADRGFAGAEPDSSINAQIQGNTGFDRFTLTPNVSRTGQLDRGEVVTIRR